MLHFVQYPIELEKMICLINVENLLASATTITHIEFICFEDGVLLMTMQAFEIPISMHIASCTTGPHLNLGPMNASHMGV